MQKLTPKQRFMEQVIGRNSIKIAQQIVAPFNLKEMVKKFQKVISESEEAVRIITQLMKEEIIAVDLEAVKLHRKGELISIQLASSS